jgi:hypothetical protein
MKKSPVVLAVTAVLFVGWLGYLATLAWKYRTPPVIVSRAQLLTAKYDVVADLTGKPDAEVTVVEVLYESDTAGPKAGEKIKVGNFAECDGYAGPGRYVLPLVFAAGQAQVAAMPFDPGRSSDPKPRIYPDSDAVRRQFAELRK